MISTPPSSPNSSNHIPSSRKSSNSLPHQHTSHLKYSTMMPSVTSRLKKNLARTKEKILQGMGKTDRTSDPHFDMYVDNFEQQHSQASKLTKELNKYIHSLRETQRASKCFYDALRDTYEANWPGSAHFHDQCQLIEHKWAEYMTRLGNDVQLPLIAYLNEFPELKKKIEKRCNRLLDYDDARHTLESMQHKSAKRQPFATTATATLSGGGGGLNTSSSSASSPKNSSSSPTSTETTTTTTTSPSNANEQQYNATTEHLTKMTKLRIDLEDKQHIYDEMNQTLCMALPVLYENRIKFYSSLFQSFFHAEHSFYADCAETKSKLDEICETLSTVTHITTPSSSNNNNNNNNSKRGSNDSSGSSGSQPQSRKASVNTQQQQTDEIVTTTTTTSDTNASTPQQPTTTSVEVDETAHHHHHNLSDSSPLRLIDDLSTHANNSSVDDEDDVAVSATTTTSAQHNESTKTTTTTTAAAAAAAASSDESSAGVDSPASSALTFDAEQASRMLKANSSPNYYTCSSQSALTTHLNAVAAAAAMSTTTTTTTSATASITVGRAAVAAVAEAIAMYRVRATYGYEAKEPDELTFHKDDSICVVDGTESEKEDLDDGWLIGVHEPTGRRGLFPENFTKRA